MISLSPTLALLDVGGGEMMMIMLIVLIFFGGDKLPGFARGLGKMIREFKKAASGVEEEIKRAMDEPPPPPPPRVINPPDDPTPGHQIMEHPLPVEPTSESAPPAPNGSVAPEANATATPAPIASTEASTTPAVVTETPASPKPEVA